MNATAKYLQLMLLCQVAMCCWGAYQSYVAIANLQKYEETIKKLAKLSSEAENQLHKTRTTQTSGALAVAVSFVVALSMIFFAPSLPPWLRFCASPVTLLLVLLARSHIKRYWAPKDGKTVGTRIPLPKMEDYSEAQRKTEELVQTLEYLEYGWAACSFIAGMRGYA